jgi:hypothetical protein
MVRRRLMPPMHNETGTPAHIRNELISQVVLTALNDPARSMYGTSAETLWIVLYRIHKDIRPYSNERRTTKVDGGLIRFVKETNPELYASITPWITAPEKETEAND